MLTHAIFWVGWIATWFDWPPVASGLDLVGAGFHVSTWVIPTRLFDVGNGKF